MRQLKINHTITKRTDTIDKYLTEIARVPLLTVEEEVALATRVQQGDTQARQQLIEANLRFVVSVAKQYENNGAPLADLISAGNIGLAIAADRFDHTRGFKFISCAVWWVRQQIIDECNRNRHVVRVPQNITIQSNKVARHQQETLCREGRNLSSIQAAEELDINPEYIAKAYSVHNLLALDAPTGENDNGTMHDYFGESADYEGLFKNDERAVLLKLLEQRLHTQEYKVLVLAFGLDGSEAISYEEIGERIGLSRERCRQLKENACKKMKSSKQLRNLLVA